MRSARFLCVALLAGCSYPEFAFNSADGVITEPPPDTAVDSGNNTLADTSVVDTLTADTLVADTFVADSTSADTLVADSKPAVDTSTDVPVDTVDIGPPECTANIDCPCAHICVASKCVAATDCTKDNHFCPAGRTCTCVAGRFQISGTGLTAGSGVVEAQPVSSSDNGADLILRDYDLRDAPAGVLGMKLRPANCTSSWFYRNVVIQCVNIGDSAGGGIHLTRRTDPVGCRPATPPDLLIDQVNAGYSGIYLGFTDLEYKIVRFRNVTSKTSVLLDTWGPGHISELIIQDSPNFPGELQGDIRKVTVINSPGFRWWTTSPTEDRSTWPKIPISYDKVSCPTGRSLVKSTTTNGVDETCAP